MKALLFTTGLAVILAGSSLRAQEQPATPADTRPQNDQTTQNALLQQLLRLSTQMETPSTPGTAQPSTDQTTQNSLVQQLVRLAMQEITQLQRQMAQDDGTVSSAPKDASAVPSDSSAPPVPSASGGDAYSTFAHAWDSALSTGGLHTGGLQTGGLHTGSLQTGRLTSGHTASGSVAAATLPPRALVAATAVSVNAPPAGSSTPAINSIPPAVSPSAPPSDPDDGLRRWSRQIDRQYATEQAARLAAVRLYPALAMRNSAFNTQFLARYAQYRQADPFGFLRGPGWPMKLAILTQGDLLRRRSGSAVSP